MTKSQAHTLADELGKRGPFSSLQQEVFLNLLRTSTQLHAEFDHLFASAKITDTQYNVLRILHGNGKPMQIYQIVEYLITPRADVSRLIDRMAEALLVTRTRCDKDRRVTWIQLASKGRKVLKKLAKPLEEMHLSQFKNLSLQELAKLNELLFRARQPGEK